MKLFLVTLFSISIPIYGSLLPRLKDLPSLQVDISSDGCSLCHGGDAGFDPSIDDGMLEDFYMRLTGVGEFTCKTLAFVAPFLDTCNIVHTLGYIFCGCEMPPPYLCLTGFDGEPIDMDKILTPLEIYAFGLEGMKSCRDLVAVSGFDIDDSDACTSVKHVCGGGQTCTMCPNGLANPDDLLDDDDDDDDDDDGYDDVCEQCQDEDLTTVGISDDCYDAVSAYEFDEEDEPPYVTICGEPENAKDVTVECQVAVAEFFDCLDSGGGNKDPSIVCDACEDEDITIIGISEECYDAVGKFDPDEEPPYWEICKDSERPSDVTIECQVALFDYFGPLCDDADSFSCDACKPAKPCFDDDACPYFDKDKVEWSSPYDGCNNGAGDCFACYPDACSDNDDGGVGEELDTCREAHAFIETLAFDDDTCDLIKFEFANAGCVCKKNSKASKGGKTTKAPKDKKSTKGTKAPKDQKVKKGPKVRKENTKAEHSF